MNESQASRLREQTDSEARILARRRAFEDKALKLLQPIMRAVGFLAYFLDNARKSFFMVTLLLLGVQPSFALSRQNHKTEFENSLLHAPGTMPGDLDLPCWDRVFSLQN